jgi:cleavage stimulation factor subunit 3
MYAYEQCLLYLATQPDIYYDYASCLQQMSISMAERCDTFMSKQYEEEAVNLYERAIKTFMKNNMLIYFSYADFEEVT